MDTSIIIVLVVLLVAAALAFCYWRRRQELAQQSAALHYAARVGDAASYVQPLIDGDHVAVEIPSADRALPPYSNDASEFRRVVHIEGTTGCSDKGHYKLSHNIKDIKDSEGNKLTSSDVGSFIQLWEHHAKDRSSTCKFYHSSDGQEFFRCINGFRSLPSREKRGAHVKCEGRAWIVASCAKCNGYNGKSMFVHRSTPMVPLKCAEKDKPSHPWFNEIVVSRNTLSFETFPANVLDGILP